jgi:hypothetical protein
MKTAVRDTGKKAAKEKAVRLTMIAATTEIISRRCLDTSLAHRSRRSREE